MIEYKKQMISSNIEAKLKEIAEYEVNIFNYNYIFEKTNDEEFKSQIKLGIDSNIRELNKTKLILKAFEAQLETL